MRHNSTLQQIAKLLTNLGHLILMDIYSSLCILKNIKWNSFQYSREIQSSHACDENTYTMYVSYQRIEWASLCRFLVPVTATLWQMSISFTECIGSHSHGKPWKSWKFWTLFQGAWESIEIQKNCVKSNKSHESFNRGTIIPYHFLSSVMEIFQLFLRVMENSWILIL